VTISFLLFPDWRRSNCWLAAGCLLLLFRLDAAAQVDLHASQGVAFTQYANLGAAFTAINNGVHAGNITVSVTQAVESSTAVLNASGSGSASYTQVTITPSGPGAVITGDIAGAVIKLNGADNVVIDGRISNQGRNLTVTNSSGQPGTAAIWLSSTGVGAGATNNTIRNLEISCGADQRSNANSTFGIIQSGSTINVNSSGGDDNDNNSYLFNRITRCRYGIFSHGVTTNNNQGTNITDNIIGPTSFGADQIGKAGIFLQGDTGAVISRNIVQSVGQRLSDVGAAADAFGIAIGAETWNVADSATYTSGDYTITQNVIHDIVNEFGFSAVGIRLGTTRAGSPTNNLVANNFIFNVRSNGGFGDQVCGIAYANGHTDKIVFNSISLTGAMDVAGSVSATTYGNAIRVSRANGTNNANLTLMDNSIYLDVTSNTASVHFYAITLNSSAYAFGAGGLNFNNYFINAGNAQLKTGGLSTTGTGGAATTEFATLANWKTALTAPQDANSIQADPQYYSTTADLRILSNSPNINVGTAIAAVTTDIDAQTRPNGAAVDIGAYEFYTLPGALQFETETYRGVEGSSVTIAVTRTSGSSGTVTVNYSLGNGTATGGAACGGSVDYVNPGTQTLTFGDKVTRQTFTVPLCSDSAFDSLETFVATLSSPGGGATLGPQKTALVNITDFPAAFNGSYTIGPGTNYHSLTNEDGIFQAINLAGATGNVTININADLTGETGTYALNQIAGGFTVTIKPSAVSRTIAGASAGPTALIKLNGADHVTIDGSTSGGTDRSLSITNNNVGGAVVWLGSASASDGATNNTIKNCNLSGTTDGGRTVVGILAGSGSFFQVPAESPNSHNTIQNNQINNARYGIYIAGGSTIDTDWTIQGNNLGSAVTAEKFSQRGMYLGNADFLVLDNTIAGVNATSATVAGIQVDGHGPNSEIIRNRISDVKASGSGLGASGIYLTSSSAANSLLIHSNFIFDVAASGSSGVTANDNGYGIMIDSGGGYQIYYNSINLNTNEGPLGVTAGINVGTGVTGSGAIDLRDNIIANTETVGTRYAVYDSSPAGAAVFSQIDFNDYFAQNVGFLASARATLANWQAATGKDASSLAADPFFVSATDLHLASFSSPAANHGTPISPFFDIDSEVRSFSHPDIGADEIASADLANLVISAGALTPTFSPGITSYTVSLAHTVTTISFTPTEVDTNSVIRINGGVISSGSTSPPLQLVPGDNIFTITVTPESLPVKTYAVTVNRAPLPPVINTNDSGSGSLRDALANSLPGDTINFTLGSGPMTIALTSGELLVTTGVTINGPGADSLTITRDTGAPPFRIFHVNSNSGTVTIQGLTISNGLASGSFPANGGGGIFNDHSNLIVQRCAITGNSADLGGGILSLRDNTGAAAGLTVKESTFAGNNAALAGGAIYNYGEASSITTFVSLVNSTLSGNSAPVGGGVYNDGKNSGHVQLSVSNSTFADNVASTQAGGIFNDGVGTASTACNLGSSILKAGTAGANLVNNSGAITSNGYNLCSDGGGGFLGATGDQINTDPLLGSLQNNGGSTKTCAPSSISPAVDKGKRDATLPFAPTNDQRNFARPIRFDNSIVEPPGGDGSDIGAVELGPPAPSPVITSFTLPGGVPTLTFTTSSTRHYSVERRDSLLDTLTPVTNAANIDGTGSPITVTDPDVAPGNPPRRFYQVIMQP
jgi:Cadherin-like beta sandwich domain/Calx-beta domain